MNTVRVLSIVGMLGASMVHGQTDATLAGVWRGGRAEVNPYTGRTFTVEFAFEFRRDGTYVEQARFGRLQILKLEGRYSLQRGGKPGIPQLSHTLMLTPSEVQFKPGREELNMLEIAYIPNVSPTQQYVGFSPNSLHLQDRSGGPDSSWGLQRVTR